MAPKRWIAPALLAGTLALGACTDAADDADDAPSDPTVGSTGASTTGGPTSTEAAGAAAGLSGVSSSEFTDDPLVGGVIHRSYPGTTYPQELTGFIEASIDDLAAFLDVEVGSINVVGVEEVTWSNAGLGCPEPGMAYTQVVTDGLRILLESGGEVFDYRTGDLSDPRRCETPLVVVDTEKKTTTTISVDSDGSVTTVTASTGQSITIRVDPDEGDRPTEGNNPPDE